MPSRRTELLVLFALGGCGRISFETVAADAPDAAPMDLRAGRWTWMGGAQTRNEDPVYGTKGVAGATNTPGARDNGAFWTRGDELWLFSGLFPTGLASDVWMYDLTAREWTWVGGPQGVDLAESFGVRGVASSTNQPGGRNDPTPWSAADGSMWMFAGTSSAENAYRDDIWRLDPTRVEWTWMGGTTSTANVPVYNVHAFDGVNTPGARDQPMVWGDGTGLWMYGGTINPTGEGSSSRRADVFQWDVALAQWKWVAGPTTNDPPIVYGTRGVFDAANQPGAGGMCAFGDPRDGSLGVIDRNSTAWRFNTTTTTWAWVGGPGEAGLSPSYGTPRVPSDSTYPGITNAPTCWTDRAGNVWMHGGQKSSGEFANDLWMYDVALDQWAFMDGSRVTNAPSTYGELGVPDDTHRPSSRLAGAAWVTADGALWLYGGDYAWDVNGDPGSMSDLWRWSAD